MTQPDTDPKPEETFTRAQVRSMIAAEVRKVRDGFADYDDLKAKAGEADKSKTQLDKLSEQMAALTSRAERAERAQARADVISTKLKGVPASIARRLTGSTREELEADAEQLVADWKEAGGKFADDGKNEQGGDKGDETPPERPAARTGRPMENLRSGAPTTAREPDETNPLKLAALIPRN
ncbi:MAG: hypothetical protein ABW022_26120 [Actinoplanes sp.]